MSELTNIWKTLELSPGRVGSLVTVGASGFRNPPWSQEWPLERDVVNAFVLGEWTAFGNGTADHPTILSRFRESLRARERFDVGVYNLARSKRSSLDRRIRPEDEQ